MDAKTYAKNAHKSVNQTYGGRSYAFHLELAFEVAQFFWYNLFTHFSLEELEVFKNSLWLHDSVEDTFNNFNSVKEKFGAEVAENVFLVSEEKGRSRKERHNHKYLIGIASSDVASLVKLCDNGANILYSLYSGSSMFNKYKQEFPNLRRYVETDKNKEICEYIQTILDSGILPDFWIEKIKELEEKYPIQYILSISGFKSQEHAQKALELIESYYESVKDSFQYDEHLLLAEIQR